MFRYLNLYASFVRFSLSRSLEFRLDFFFRIFMDCIYYAVQLIFYKVLFLNTNSIGGWTESQAMIFVSAYIVVDGIQMTLFSNNLWWFPSLVNKGDLDYYLIRPISSLFFVSLRDFATNSLVNLLIALGISFWSLYHYPEPISGARIFLYYIFILLGAGLHYLLGMLSLIPIFWTHSASGFRQIFWTMSRLMERPDSIFQGWTRKFLVSLIPFSIIASFPSRIIFDQLNWTFFLHILAVEVAFFVLVIFLWRLGLKSYSSASS